MNDQAIRLFYIFFGVINLLMAVLFTFGAAFSSYGISALAVLLVDLPLALGLIAAIEPRRPFAPFMLLGCTVVVLYICVATYFRIKSGFPPQPVSIAWAILNVIEGTLAFISFQQQRRNGVMTWPQ
jgi:hypothetical protein